MDKFRNIINKVVQKYTNFKAKINTFKNKILNGIHNTITIVEVKLKRIKVNFNSYIDKVLESLSNLKSNISILKKIHFINKATKLENKLVDIKFKFR